MAVRIEGANQLEQLAARLGEADKAVRKNLVTGLRAATKPVVAEIRGTVKGPGGGSRGSGAQARAAHRLSRSKSTRASAAKSAEKRSGLRATIAAATGSSVTSSADRVNVTFRVKSSQLPPDQKTLAKRWNSAKGWRHPVWGHRDRYVQQSGRPYFDSVIRRNEPLLTAGVERAVTTAVRIFNAGT